MRTRKRSAFTLFFLLVVAIGVSLIPYHVLANATHYFGHTTIEASEGGFENLIYATKFTLSTADSGTYMADNLTVALRNDNTGKDFDVKGALYDSSLNFINGTDETVNDPFTSSFTWYAFNFTEGTYLTNNTVYWLCMWASNTGGATVYMAYHTGATSQFYYQSLGYGEWPASLSGGTYDDLEFSIYCGYNVTDEEGQDLEFELSETIAITESMEIGRECYSETSETIAITDSGEYLGRERAFLNNLETVQPQSLVDSSKALYKESTETVIPSASLELSKELAFLLSEITSVTTSLKMWKERFFVLSQSITVTMSLDTWQERLFPLSETVAIQSLGVDWKEIAYTFTETIDITAIVDSSKALAFITTETIGITESMELSKELLLVLSETIIIDSLLEASFEVGILDLLFVLFEDIEILESLETTIEIGAVAYEFLLTESVIISESVEMVSEIGTTLTGVYAIAAIGFILAIAALAITLSKRE